MFYKNKFTFLFVLLIVALCFNFANAAKKQLTPEQQALKNKMRAERMKKSEAADKLIHHSTIEEFEENVLGDNGESLWVVFYGSKRCPHTQKFNPKWLQFQENMENGLYDLDDVKFTKIECYGDQFDFCVSQGNQYWPELMFYYKGVKKGSYDGEDEIEDIVKYIKQKKPTFMKKKTTKTVKPSKSGLPTKRPTKQPAKSAPPTERPTKRPPPPPKELPTTKQVEETKSNEIEVENEVENTNTNNDVEEVNNGIDDDDTKDNEVNNGVDDYNNEADNGIEDDEYIPDSNANTGNNQTYEEESKGSSHTLVYSIGGCAACVAGFLFAKKRFRGNGYSRIGGGERTAQMKYKYDKHIV